MKKSILLLFYVFLFVISCTSTTEKKNSFPPPPNQPVKNIIHYKGKEIEMNDDEYKKFLDSLHIKDTIIGHIE